MNLFFLIFRIAICATTISMIHQPTLVAKWCCGDADDVAANQPTKLSSVVPVPQPSTSATIMTAASPHTSSAMSSTSVAAKTKEKEDAAAKQAQTCNITLVKQQVGEAITALGLAIKAMDKLKEFSETLSAANTSADSTAAKATEKPLPVNESEDYRAASAMKTALESLQPLVETADQQVTNKTNVLFNGWIKFEQWKNLERWDQVHAQITEFQKQFHAMIRLTRTPLTKQRKLSLSQRRPSTSQNRLSITGTTASSGATSSPHGQRRRLHANPPPPFSQPLMTHIVNVAPPSIAPSTASATAATLTD